MQSLPHDLYTTAQIREMEQLAINQHAISASVMMSRAAHAALSVIQQHWPDTKHITVLCGSGNNGGDGFDLARFAHQKGINVTVFQVSETTAETANLAKQALLEQDIAIEPFTNLIPDTDIIVDAIFGTGLNRPVEGECKTAIELINTQNNTPVIALDIPSGLEADTGHVLGSAVIATTTISFIGLTLGLITGQGPDHCGRIELNTLNLPDDVFSPFTSPIQTLQLDDYQALLAPRQRTGHKGLYGHTLIIGGNHGFSGAARIAAEAAARTGSGLTSIATRADHASMLNLTRPELMCHGIEQAEALTPLLEQASAVVLGPGLGQSGWAQMCYQQTLATPAAKVIDADALNLLSQNPQQQHNWVLTPHPGEAARLLNCSTQDIQANRLQAVTTLQAHYGGVVVLKGAGTLICDGNEPTYISTAGNPGLASGGTGDALAGIIGSLLSQGHNLLDAACLGVLLHGHAADLAAQDHGERGMLALDLLPYVRQLVNQISH